MTTARLLLIFAAAFLAMLAASAPVGLALAAVGGLSAARAEGTVWNGRLEGARLGALDLGRVKLSMAPLSLLTGAVRIRAEASGGAVAGRARLVAGRGGQGIEAAGGSAPLSALRVPAPLTGTLRLEDVEAVFDGGACARAGGRLEAEVGGLGDRTFFLAGEPACEGGRLATELTGERDGERVTLRIEAGADGRHRSEVRVASPDLALGEALKAAGFARRGASYARSG